MNIPREDRMVNEAACTWPECACKVPDYAFSAHNRVNFCERLKAFEEEPFNKKRSET